MDVDLNAQLLHVRRLKNGQSGCHALLGDELVALTRLRERNPCAVFVFESERGGRMHRQNVNRLLGQISARAGMPFAVNPHALRHSCGFALARRGTDTRRIQLYLGHRSILSTVAYTDLAGGALEGLWADQEQLAP